MRETTVQRAHRVAVLVFIATLTTVLLAFVFGQAARGLAGLPGVLVYAFAAGFGLEFLGSAWTGGWRQRGSRRQLQS